MTPLQIFHQHLQPLINRPYSFLNSKDKLILVENVQQAIDKLLSDLKKKNLAKTKAFKTLEKMKVLLNDLENKEMQFLITLDNLFDVYREAPLEEDFRTELDRIDLELSAARKRSVAYYRGLELLEQNGEKLTPEQKTQADIKILQEVGIFLVIEYTLQIQAEIPKLTDAEKLILVKKGFKTETASLPALLKQLDNMLFELCFKLYDEKLRSALMTAFYILEDVLLSEQVEDYYQALKDFHLSVLPLFQEKGIGIYQGKFYAPYGNNISMQELIQKI